MRSELYENELVPPVNEDDHSLGPDTSPVTLVEFGDFECPYCGQAHLIVKQVLRHLGDNVRFVFRHFPLSRIHPYAQRAAEAAEAAGAQGKFWEMHDMLYANQHALDDIHLLQYAAALGLNMPHFRQALAQGVYVPYVREDFMSGVHSGVNGTPTFFINGLRHDGSWDAESLIAAMQHAAVR